MGRSKAKLRSSTAGTSGDFGLNKKMTLRGAPKKPVTVAERFIQQHFNEKYNSRALLDACISSGSMPAASFTQMRSLAGKAFEKYPELRNSLMYRSFQGEKEPLVVVEEQEEEEEEEAEMEVEDENDDEEDDDDDDDEDEEEEEEDDDEEPWVAPGSTLGPELPIKRLIGEMGSEETNKGLREVVDGRYRAFRSVEGEGSCYFRAQLLGAVLAARNGNRARRTAHLLDRLDAMASVIKPRDLAAIKDLLALSAAELADLRVDPALDEALVTTGRALAAEYLEAHHEDIEDGVTVFEKLCWSRLEGGDRRLSQRDQWDGATKKQYIQVYCRDVIRASRWTWADDFTVNYGLLPRALGIRTVIRNIKRVEGDDDSEDIGSVKLTIPDSQVPWGAFGVHLLRTGEHYTILIKGKKQ